MLSHSDNGILHWWAVGAERSCWLVLAIGTLLRIFLWDNVPVLSAVYYATPPVILFALAAILSIWHLSRKRKIAAGLAVIMATFWISWNIQSNVRWAGKPTVSNDMPVLFWNVRHGASGWSGVEEHIRSVDPPIAGFVEAWHDRGPQGWQEAFPEFEIRQRLGGLLVMTKGKIVEESEGNLGPYGLFLNVLVRLDGRDYRVIVVDLMSNPVLSRRQAMLELAALVERHKDERLLVMGDFNMPLRSVHFERILPHMSHAFETYGRGYAATWPCPLPVLDLDHVWTSGSVSVSCCRHGWSLDSDHRSVVLWCH